MAIIQLSQAITEFVQLQVVALTSCKRAHALAPPCPAHTLAL
jgi:hypothetical protein